MNKYLKNFLQRGIAFGGFGPIVAGIVLFVIELAGVKLDLSGVDILLAIISTYLLAFLQAGASVFNQIESWSIAKSMGAHFSTIYIAYVACYLLNRWIPFDWGVVGVFTAIFVAAYLIIWFTVYIIVKRVSKNLNKIIN